jgi:DNA-directed RNA polymerase delta subunit
MDEQIIRAIILDTIEASLDAQLRAVRRMRQPALVEEPKAKGMSQVDMAYDILNRATQPLHITKIIDKIETVHGVRLDRESLVSALSKRVARDDRFMRTDKNTFSLKGKQP